MRDDVTQVPVVQIATHIWRESGKHLLDLGKGLGVSLDQGQVGDRARGHPRVSGRMSLSFKQMWRGTKARPVASPPPPPNPVSLPRSQGETMSADP